jgi:hypothetical protein
VTQKLRDSESIDPVVVDRLAGDGDVRKLVVVVIVGEPCSGDVGVPPVGFAESGRIGPFMEHRTQLRSREFDDD